VAVEGFPGWGVEVVVMQTPTGMAVTDLHITPWQVTVMGPRRGTWQLGSLVSRANEPGPGSGWSEIAENVPAGGVPSRLLRAINVGQLAELAQREGSKRAGFLDGVAGRFETAGRGDLAGHYRDELTESLGLTGAPAQKPGRRGNGIEHYLVWARRYALMTSTTRSPIKALAAKHANEIGGAENVTFVRDTITDARRRYGLLTSTGQGRAGGQLTEKAQRLVERAKLEES